MLKFRLHCVLALCALLAVASAAGAQNFSVTKLVTDDQAAHPGQITDAGLKNAWGLASSSAGALWVSSNGAGTSPLYSINAVTQATAKLGLVVTIPRGRQRHRSGIQPWRRLQR
ncbi:hypothetical protein BH11PSE10_BH11PSE10_03120 [soil metagenome]